MALSGVRISWLILARKSDFADDARLRLALGVEQARPRSSSRTSCRGRWRKACRRRPIARQRHEQRDEAAVAAAADDVAAVARACCRACWRLPSASSTSRWLSGANRLANGSPVDLAACIAEQLLRAAIDRLHLGVGSSTTTPSAAASSNVADFRASSALAWRSAVSKVFCRSSPPLPAADAGQHQHQRGFALPRRGEQPRLHRHLVALIGGDGERLRAVVGAELVGGSARRTARRVRRPAPARATGRSRSSRGRRGWHRSTCRADRPARRSAGGRGWGAGRPPAVRIAGSACARGWGTWRKSRAGAARHRRRGVGHLLRLVLGAAQACGEAVGQFAESVALDRRQRRHAVRRMPKRETARHSRAAASRSAARSSRNTGGSTRGAGGVGARRVLRQFADARDIAANAEAAIAAEVAVAVEHRQSGQFDGQAGVGAVDREGDL